MSDSTPPRSSHARLRAGLLIAGGAVVALTLLDCWLAVRRGVSAPLGTGPFVLLGALLVAVGTLGRKVVPAYRGIATVILNVVLLLVVVEGASALLLRWRARHRVERSYEEMAWHPFYRDKPWAAEYWREFEESKPMGYAPFVIFRRRPYDGQYIHIDRDRHRVTPGASCAPGAFVVYTFGGSTMWGTGSPDSASIPAYLQQGLAKRIAGPVCVVNFGESAYVSLQGMLQLALQLRAGARPNAVVFYDGINDIGTTWQFGHAGSHSDQADIAATFERRSAIRRLVEQTSTYAVLRQSFAPVRRDTIRTATLADSVVSNYVGVTEVVRALGKAYGFRTLFFWQPALSESGKTMTALERREVQSRARRHLQLFAETYARMRAIAARDSADDMHDLSSVLADIRGDVFLDQAHITPEGNARVAAAMLRAWDGLPDCTAAHGCAPAALAAR